MTTVQEQQLHEIVGLKLNELRQAICELQKRTVPYTPLPRPKIFKLLDDADAQIIWPSNLDNLYTIKIKNSEYSFQFNITIYLIEKVCIACKYQPTKVLKFVRRIDAAIEWCKRRTEGRKRAAEEIWKQQKKAVDVITALSVASKLTGTP